ncbi:MAG: DUF6516 family protein [Rhodoferax sp.]|nr:DUF6516 family protein [Rhodoferax sp.]
MADRKIVDETNYIPSKRGNGILRREVWVNSDNAITRYNLAYIQVALFSGDNGRVIGYDNAHGFHHRHYFGKVEPVVFVSFEDIESKFQDDWLKLRSVI